MSKVRRKWRRDIFVSTHKSARRKIPVTPSLVMPAAQKVSEFARRFMFGGVQSPHRQALQAWRALLMFMARSGMMCFGTA